MRRLVLALLLASVRQVAAQTPCADLLSSLPTGDLAWCATEQAPSLVVQTPVRYPDVLRAAKISGDVVLEVTIDTSGRIDFQTLNVRVETHPFFTRAVRQSMPAWWFVPARLDGKLVRARGVFHIEFLMPKHDSIPRDAVVGPARETRTGLDVAVGWRPLAYDPPPTLDTTRLYGLIAAIARRHGSVDTTRALCLEWSQSREQREPPAALIDYLRDHGAARLPPSRCPPTYASMFLRIDSLGRPVPLPPPGAVDPQILSIGDLRPWAKDLFVFRYSVGVGMRREVGHCQGQWDASASEWRINCTGVHGVVS